ncbi:hypothetical protein ACQ1Z0_13955, partial [Enterococcus faecalis]
IPIICGVGSNDTRDSDAFVYVFATFAGYVAVLEVVPFFYFFFFMMTILVDYFFMFNGVLFAVSLVRYFLDIIMDIYFLFQ